MRPALILVILTACFPTADEKADCMKAIEEEADDMNATVADCTEDILMPSCFVCDYTDCYVFTCVEGEVAVVPWGEDSG